MPLINLGFAALVQGREAEADEIFSQALADREKEYGSNDKISFV
jgi:Tfp pilus assembly protein PilF